MKRRRWHSWGEPTLYAGQAGAMPIQGGTHGGVDDADGLDGVVLVAVAVAASKFRGKSSYGGAAVQRY